MEWRCSSARLAWLLARHRRLAGEAVALIHNNDPQLLLEHSDGNGTTIMTAVLVATAEGMAHQISAMASVQGVRIAR